jgi:hypothetical protein
MRNMNSGAVLFNLSGAAVLITVVGYMGYAFFRTEEIATCATRYPAGKQFAFDSQAGQLLTPIELQGRAGSREWGILQNTRIVESAGSLKSASLQVNLAPTGDDDNANRNGVGFTWPSSELAKATSACLSYNVLLPPKFAFAEPGYLPGLYAVSDVAELDSQTPSEGFAARVGWAQGGDVGVEVRAPGTANAWQGASTNEPWPLGRWVPVQQEITLNSAGAENGTLRLWVDGKLRLENQAVVFKSNSLPGLSGVVADIGYSRAASIPDAIQVSPFVVQWQ